MNRKSTENWRLSTHLCSKSFPSGRKSPLYSSWSSFRSLNHKITRIVSFWYVCRSKLNKILIMSNVAGLQLIYGVTDVLNCQSKLILKVIQGHQGEKSQLRMSLLINRPLSFKWFSKDSFSTRKYQRLTTPTPRYTYSKSKMIRYGFWGVVQNCTERALVLNAFLRRQKWFKFSVDGHLWSSLKISIDFSGHLRQVKVDEGHLKTEW